MFVEGDSQQRRLVAIVVLSDRAAAELPQNDAAAVNYAVLQKLQSCAQSNRLSGIETPHALYISQEEFTVDNGLLTATMKLRRHCLRQHFRKEIDEMYDLLASNNKQQSRA